MIVFTIVAVLSLEYLVYQGLLPPLFSYVPEVLAMVVAILVIVAGVRSRFQFVRPVYWLTFGALALVVLCGAIANQMEPGPVFAGIRHYLRALPFFFLPAVLEIKERQLRVQLLLLSAFGLLQLPIAWAQRMTTVAEGSTTGDHTFGTLMNSATLTLFLVSAACVLTGFFLQKRISAKRFFPLIFLLLVPTMVNETKAVIVLVPVALMTVFVVGATRGARLKNMVIALATIACFAAVFIPVYDHFQRPRWGYGIVDFFTMEGRLEGYLDRGSKIGEYEERAGKLGGLKVALAEVSRDPINLVFGLGIGNVSDSALGRQFTGRYYDVYRVFLTGSAIYIVFEFGLAGLGLVLLFYWLLFKDSVSVAHRNAGIMGALATGWAGVLTVILIGIFYENIIESRALSVLFWYFSGLIAAYRMRLVSGAFDASTDSVVSNQFPSARRVDTAP